MIKWVKNLLSGPDFIVDGGITWLRGSLRYRNRYFRKLYIDRILPEPGEEGKHRRGGKGTETGGQFTSGGGSSLARGYFSASYVRDVRAQSTARVGEAMRDRMGMSSEFGYLRWF